MKNLESPKKSAFQTLIEDNVDYNLWANQSMLNWLESHSPDKLTEKVPSSFDSILATIEHLYSVQDFWFKMLKKESYDFNVENSYERAELFQKLIDESTLLKDYVYQLDEFELCEKVEILTPWFSSNQPRYELIQHIMVHTAYHRGQVVTMGRNLGITNATNTDFNYYLLMAKSKTNI